MLNLLKKVSLCTAATALVLGVAMLTNLNAALVVEAEDEDEASTQVIDLVKENLQTTIDQIEADELYQKFTQLFDLVEQVESTEDDEEIDIEVIKEIVETAAEIGNGSNDPSAERGDYFYLSDAELDALIDSIKTIAHYQEYYELATLVQTAHKVIYSDEFSADYVARIVEITTDAALDTDISIKNDYTAASSSNGLNTSTTNQSQSITTNTWVQIALNNQGKNQISSTTKGPGEQTTTDNQSSESTITDAISSIVERPNASHADTDGLTNYNASLADALAHTSTVCIAIGTVVIGGLSVHRQQKADD